MSENINYNILFNAQGAEVQRVISQMNRGFDGVQRTVTGVSRSITGMLSTIRLSAAISQIQGVAQGFNDIAASGLDLSTSMYDLSALTGVAGKQLQEIEGYARESAKAFGTSAAGAVESYKLVLSQLGPQIAQQPKALKEMGNSIATLSKTMGGDAAAATTVLTTALNQYQVSLDDPMYASQEMARFMNVMAAAAQEGSAELPQIQAALEQSGMAAKTAGVSFEELNASIQVLDKAGKKGSEGGVAVRNVLSTLAQGRFLPKDTQKALQAAGVDMGILGDQNKSLADRLTALKPIMTDQALVTKLFGKENSNAAIAMLSGIDEMRSLTDAITGTTSAYDQAAVVMESPAEKAARLKAKVDDLKISLFNGTNGWLGYAGVLGDVTRDLTNLWPAFDALGKGMNVFSSTQRVATAATQTQTAAQGLLNATMWACPVVWIVAAIAAIVGVFVLAYKHSDAFRQSVGQLWDSLKMLAEPLMQLGALLWSHLQGALLAIIKILAAVLQPVLRVVSSLITAVATAISRVVELFSRARESSGLLGKAFEIITFGPIKLLTAALEYVADLLDRIFNKGLKEAGQWGAVAGKIGAKNLATIAPANLPGARTAPEAPQMTSGQSSVPAQTTSAIATGGTKYTTVNVNLGNLVHTFNLTANNIKEGAQKMRDEIIEELTRALEMGVSLGA